MRSYDFGYGKPFSLAWWAVDYDGVLYRIMEMYGCTQTPNEGVKWSPDEQFRRIREVEDTHPWLKGRKIVDSVADPAIWDASRGESIAETAARYGIYFTPGTTSGSPEGCRCITACNSTRRAMPGCMSLTAAGRLSAPCR